MRFGPAGNSPAFYASGGKSSVDVPKWLNSIGLNAYEYQCGHGVRIKEETARRLGKNARQNDISISIHAPYYINLCSTDSEKLSKTKRHILKSMQAAKWMNAAKVVFHPGSVGDLTREEAFENAVRVLEDLYENDIPEWNVQDIVLTPETMGKKKQFGMLDEILKMCKIFDMQPTIDFAHIHAVGEGALKTSEDYIKVIETVANKLGESSTKFMHVHFSPIKFTSGGEKKHVTTKDEEFGPEFEDFAEIIIKYDLDPTIICESNGRQAEDALIYKSIIENLQQQR